VAHSSKERLELESLMDRMGVAGLFEALSQIASEKDYHLRTNWQDSRGASRWAKLAVKFDKLAASIDDPYYQY
jgi:hypothetical protein